MNRRPGKVWMVGGGPGDPELLTVKAARIVSSARVLAYDELVSDEVMALAPADAERTPVGRRARGCRYHEGRIHPVIIERALAGHDVVRLKGGDPFVFGRGGEEAEELAAAGVPFEVVPGISAALGAAASTHIPLTHRDVASSLTFATAHLGATDADATAFAASMPPLGTLVFYMGLGTLEATLHAILSTGRDPSTPAAVVGRATRPDQTLTVATLGTLAEKVLALKVPGPALVIVGEVVSRRVVSPAVDDPGD